MSRQSIGLIIVLAIVSVAGILTTQAFWLNQALTVQRSQQILREEQLFADSKQFNDRVTIALSNVANEILTINNDPTQVFQAVRQINSNYFIVAINDTVHPYLLESLLMREFDRRNIREDFEYGIYDCFTDSIVYGNFVAMSSDTVLNIPPQAPQIKWDKDGHYFGVFFPERESFANPLPQQRLTTWVFSSAIMLIVILFFGFSIRIVLRQKRLSEVKTDFINNMTHELKTPISTISLASEALLNPEVGSKPERRERYAQIIFSENQRLKNQVDRVLQLAALDKDRLDLKAEKINMHDLIQACLHSFKVSVDGRDGILSASLNAHNPMVWGDPVHLANILYNLLDNANKYSPEKLQIEVKTENAPGLFVLSVSDSGIGMESGALTNIFDKFYRIPTGNRHDVKGFGLGLFYVKMMTEAHNGVIEVESRLNIGSMFTIKLPLYKEGPDA